MEDEDIQFVDAPEDFPFYDCLDFDDGADQIHDSPTSSATNQIIEDDSGPQKSSNFINSPAANLRRRSQRSSFDDSGLESRVIYGTGSVSNFGAGKGRRYRRYKSVKQQEKKADQTRSSLTEVDDHVDQVVVDGVNSVSVGELPETQTNEEVVENSAGRVGDEEVGNSPAAESIARVNAAQVSGLEWPANVLVFLVQLIVKATWFQVRVFMGFLTFPIWSLYFGYMFVLDPIQTAKRSVNCALRKASKVWDVVFRTISPYVYEWLKDQKSVWKLALQFAWGFFWAVYVCTVLCVLLVCAFVASRVLMNSLVEEPVHIEETLYFDYTQHSPVAFIHVAPDEGVYCRGRIKEMVEVGKSAGIRLIPPNQEMQVEVLLTLPESDYNRNLGMFQIRVDFLAANGKVLASVSRPCMLQYKSDLIRLILTLLEMVPLATGYLSESQTVHVKMRGFPAGDVPTACLRVTIEQRAEFRPGGGIPEIYTASLILESALPFLKKLLWSWRKTLFIWLSLMIFITELTFGLLCCQPMMLPRLRARNTLDMNANQDFH